MITTIKTNLRGTYETDASIQSTENFDLYVKPVKLRDDGDLFDFPDVSIPRHPNNKFCFMDGSFILEELSGVMFDFNEIRGLKHAVGSQLSVQPSIYATKEYVGYDLGSDHIKFELYDPHIVSVNTYYNDTIDFEDLLVPFYILSLKKLKGEDISDSNWVTYNNIATSIFYTQDYVHRITCKLYADAEVADSIYLDVLIDTYKSLADVDSPKEVGSFDFSLYIAK